VAFVGVEQGILLAMVLSLVDHTRRGYRPRNAVLVPAGSGWEGQQVATGAQAAPGLVIYRFTHSMYYANAEQLSQEITSLVNTTQPPLRWLCIEASAVDDIDYTAAETLRSIFVMLKDKGVRLAIVNVSGDITAESQYGLTGMFGADAIYRSLDDVVRAYHREPEPAPQQHVGGTEPGTRAESVVPRQH
jgi:MFS superfamily sulfate permease-like transporter